MAKISIKGIFYDGQSSGRHAGELIVSENKQVDTHGIASASCHLDEIEIPSRLGNTSRLLRLPSGYLFESNDNKGLDHIAALAKNTSPILNPHLWESKLTFIIAAVIGFVLFTYIVISHGIPSVSETITKSLPNHISEELAEGVLEQLDEIYLEPSKLETQVKQHYQALFEQVIEKQSGFQYHLYFRSSNIVGANAFALPNGNIIITDALVNLVEHDEELIAVLYHELGHVVEHHALRQLIEASAITVFFAWVFDDIEGIAHILLGGPAFLIQTAYSRAHETHADSYALKKLIEANIDPLYFSSIMQRLSMHPEIYTQDKNMEPPNKKEDSESWMSYFSTHPAINKRILRFQKASEQWQSSTESSNDK